MKKIDGIIDELSNIRKQNAENNTNNTKLNSLKNKVKNEEYFSRYIIENSLDMIVAVDKKRNIIEFNKAASEAFGYSKEEIIGVNVNILYDDEEESNKISLVMNKNGYYTGEVKNRRKNGEVFISFLSASLIKDENGIIIGAVGSSRDITIQKQAATELEYSREQLRSLNEHLTQIREEERTKISRHIHDEFGQALTALKMNITFLQNNAPYNDESFHEKFNSIFVLIDNMLKTTNKMIEELRPTMLDYFGLEAAIDYCIEDFKTRTGTACETHIHLSELTLDQTRSTTLYRIIQESLTNISRHACASKVSIEIKSLKTKLHIKIKDNGKGITDRQINSLRSYGIIGMRERILLMKGEFHVKGVIDEGTVIEAYIPLDRRSISR